MRGGIVMRQSRTFIPTTREVPSSAEATSHKLLIKAGMVKQVSAGVYTHLPLATRVIQKIEKVIREEHEKIGAVELLMPILQSDEYWKKSGRWNKMGDELIRVTDRKNAGYALSPTAEEIICQTVSNMVTSYKQLPVNLYQIQTKFRDEIRPRLGLLRCKEFIMKDGYSFHDTPESLRETYKDYYQAYSNIFDRFELKYRAVKADSGNIGGSYTHEFQALAEVGEDTIAYTEESDYAANIETAAVVEQNYTIPTGFEKKERSLLETPNQQTIDDIAAYCGVDVNRAMKALALKADGEFYLVLMRGNDQLNDIKFMKATGTSEVEMATEQEIEEVMGGVVGYMGPFGIKNCKVIGDNAIKYTEDDGHVIFTVRTNDRHLYISVADNGPGISDSDKKKIFDRFYRVDKARTRQKGGFGLGLSLAQQIVLALKGTIVVKDNQPKGTIFEVKITGV